MPDGLLSQEHEAALRAAKQKLREENEEYIRQHPELRGAIRLLMAKLLDDTPDDLQQYVCEFAHATRTSRGRSTARATSSAVGAAAARGVC